MRACAALAVARDARPDHAAQPRISRLRSEPPFVLRPVGPTGVDPLPRWNLGGPATIRVALAAGAAGPIGGDELSLDVEVGTGVALVLSGVAATLALPGPHHRPSSTEVTVRVASGGTLVWLPGPLIAARGCDHRTVTHVALAPGARLLVREELLLGRHGEQPGSVQQRLRVQLGDRPLLDQDLRLGAGSPGWDGPAVIGGRRAVGSVLVVDPEWEGAGLSTPPAWHGTDVARLPLDGPAVLVTALASDGIILRRRVDAALAADDSGQSG